MPSRNHSATGTKSDVVVVGSGPNGLAAAIVCAQSGCRVRVFEAETSIGGGTRTEQLTLPGFRHDTCSAVHPMAAATVFLSTLPLGQHGLAWVHPPVALAHPLDDGTAAVIYRSLPETIAGLGQDGLAYRRLIGETADHWRAIEHDTMGKFRWPRHPLPTARFGLHALRPASSLGRTWFKTPHGRALFAGLAAHSAVPLEDWGSSAIAIILAAAAHRAGWPIAAGGSRAISSAMASYLHTLGGEIETGRRIQTLADLPPARLTFFDTSPRSLADICGNRLPAAYQKSMRDFRLGPGVFKLDWALSGPIPWSAPACRQAGTVHLGGTMEEVMASERQACAPSGAQIPERPFVLLSQPSLFDPSRAPAGQHTAWAYCHVPNGCTTDMTARIEAQIERFAPGFQSLILARSARSPADIEHHNANMLGGDITGGRNSLRQILLRPTRQAYATPLDGIYICSASTPPGGGVHGLCGVHAARTALRAHPHP